MIAFDEYNNLLKVDMIKFEVEEKELNVSLYGYSSTTVFFNAPGDKYTYMYDSRGGAKSYFFNKE